MFHFKVTLKSSTISFDTHLRDKTQRKLLEKVTWKEEMKEKAEIYKHILSKAKAQKLYVLIP